MLRKSYDHLAIGVAAADNFLTMRDIEPLYRALIDACPDSVFLCDAAGCILFANPAAARLYGYKADELGRMSVRDFEDPADAHLVPELIRRFQTGESLYFEAGQRRKDGSSFLVEVSATRLNDGNDELILAFVRDLSERKRSEHQSNLVREELAKISRLVTLTEMVSGLVHKLNQPLAALSLYIDSATELAAQYDSAPLNECLRRITEQVQHTREIIRRKLAIAERIPTCLQYVSINSLIKEVVAALDSELKRAGICTTLELSENVGFILTEGVHIKQVLVNLIRNAVEALSACDIAKRQLTIGTQTLDNQVRVSVADSGKGLDPAIAKRLFVHFETNKPEGLGLGLAICRNLIEALGGRIGVQPSSGNGTTFFFELPKSSDSPPS